MHGAATKYPLDIFSCSVSSGHTHTHTRTRTHTHTHTHTHLPRNPLRWFLVILVTFIIRVNAGNIIAATALFINNSVVFEQLGEVNGVANSLTAVLRCATQVLDAKCLCISFTHTHTHTQGNLSSVLWHCFLSLAVKNGSQFWISY